MRQSDLSGNTRLARSSVPPDVRRRCMKLVEELGSEAAAERALCVSRMNWEELTKPNGLVTTRVLERVQLHLVRLAVSV